MSNKRITVIYLFFFLIPYIACLLIVGISYNALVLHAISWRIILGGIIGAFGLFAVKVIAQRPILIMYRNSTRPALKKFINLFILERNFWIISFNLISDFIFSIISIYLVKNVLPISHIMGNTLGWLVLILMLSVTFASYLEFDALSIYKEDK
ncbi:MULTISPECIES: hypothetical protein [Lactobacillaceae]|uniref:hypothetical protein n=1 Tax=Lactobacillaceae TaxID=33958 RepID=UPI000C1B6A7A|nr:MULTISPECIES: hypothetical protein [Lactobacillaceae]